MKKKSCFIAALLIALLALAGCDNSVHTDNVNFNDVETYSYIIAKVYRNAIDGVSLNTNQSLEKTFTDQAFTYRTTDGTMTGSFALTTTTSDSSITADFSLTASSLTCGDISVSDFEFKASVEVSPSTNYVTSVNSYSCVLNGSTYTFTDNQIMAIASKIINKICS